MPLTVTVMLYSHIFVQTSTFFRHCLQLNNVYFMDYPSRVTHKQFIRAAEGKFERELFAVVGEKYNRKT